MFFTLSLILFLLAVLGGIYLAQSFMNNRSPGNPVVIAHGIAAVLGLVALVIAAARVGVGLFGGLSIAFFIAAAIVGILMYTGKSKPAAQIIAIHAILAGAGFILLLVYGFRFVWI